LEGWNLAGIYKSGRTGSKVTRTRSNSYNLALLEGRDKQSN
jgi:hypothetical protein